MWITWTPPSMFMEPNQPKEFGNVRKDSADFGSVPQDSEVFRNVPNHSERKENHTLTVREAARMFEAAGVARTERSIVNWCHPNKMGVSRLDSYFDPNERKYFITPQSVESAIAEEIAKAANRVQSSDAFGSVPKDTERREKGTHERSGIDAGRSGDVEKEMFDLKITNRAKDMFIEQLQQERERLVEQLVSSSRKVGELETRLLQLTGPKNQDAPVIDARHQDSDARLEQSP